MKRFFILMLSFVCGLTYSCTTQDAPNPERETKALRFTSNRSFKILQFTDLHWHMSLPIFNSQTYYLVKHQVLEEQPQLVVFTGDVAFSPTTLTAYYNMASLMEELQVPFAVALGNHDTECGTDAETIFHLLSQFDHFVGENGTVSGCGNYELPIYSSDSDYPKAVIYVMDTHAYTSPIGGDYDWIKQDQIDWFAQTNNSYKSVPAWLFFHIPLPEMTDLRDSGQWVGECGEEPMPPKYNSGFFDCLVSQSNVRGVFCGHDHVNNIIGKWEGIWMGYGQRTGYGGYGYPFPCGSRVIDLTEDSQTFYTYLRYSDSSINYPLICE